MITDEPKTTNSDVDVVNIGKWEKKKKKKLVWIIVIAQQAVLIQ